MDDPKQKYPLGYIVNFLEYATYPATHRQLFSKYLDKSRLSSLKNDGRSMNYSLLAFGDFDRISAEKIESFSRYRDIDEYTKLWLGPRQSVLLYAIDDNKKDDILNRLFIEQTEDCSEEDSVSSSHNTSRFIIFTLIGLDPRLHQVGRFSDEISLCRNLIKQQIAFSLEKLRDKEKNSWTGIDYEVYGSFSSSELVIVWAAKQYVEVLQLVDFLRNLRLKDDNNRIISPFISLYSLVAQHQLKNITPKACHDEVPVQGTVEIHLAFQNCIEGEGGKGCVDSETLKGCTEIVHERQQYLEDLLKSFRDDAASDKRPDCSAKDVTGYGTAGEFDYAIRLPADLVCRSVDGPGIFHSDGKLHWRNSDFSKYILKSRTDLFYPPLNLGDQYSQYVIQPQSYQCVISEETKALDALLKIKKKMFGCSDKTDKTNSFCGKYNEVGIRGIIKDHFPETDGLCDTIDLLYLDYVNNCSNCISSAWVNILTEQFSAVLDHIASLIYWAKEDSKRVSSKDLFNGIEKIANDFKQVVSHIAQSQRNIFVVPSCHLLYLGQYDLILHAYYAFQQYLLSIIYQLNSTSKQPELIPLYTIDVIPDIKASMYKIWEGLGEKVIISINMPSAAMVHFLRYSMVITHETFHFVPPQDRDKRNQIFGMLYFSEAFLTQLLSEGNGNTMVQSELEEYRQISDDLIRKLTPIVFDCGREVYLIDIQREVDMEAGSEKPLEWGKYKRVMLRVLRHFLRNPNLLNHILEEFRKNKANICAIIDNMGSTPENDKRNNMMKKMKTYLLERTSEAIPDLLGVDPQELYRHSEELSQAFSEASQDLAVVGLFELEPVDYLVWLGRSRNDIVNLNKTYSSIDAYRLGMVCDYLLSAPYQQTYGKIPDAQWVKNRLKELKEPYIELFQAVPEMRSNEEPKQQTYKKNIEDSFTTIKKVMHAYLVSYDNLRPLIIIQLADADLRLRPELREELSKKILAGFYSKWKTAILSHDDEAVFKNSLHMIQEFQAGASFYTNQGIEKRNRLEGE